MASPQPGIMGCYLFLTASYSPLCLVCRRGIACSMVKTVCCASNPSKEKQAVKNSWKAPRRVWKDCRFYWACALRTEKWFSISAFSDFSVAAFGISCIVLRWLHCLIKTCRWINRNTKAAPDVRAVHRGLARGWCQFGVRKPVKETLSGLRNRFFLFLATRDLSPLMKYREILTLGIPCYWQHWHVKIENHKPLLAQY